MPRPRRVPDDRFVPVLTEIGDPDTVGAAWRALEARSDCSFFQGWTWTGCLAAERFRDAVLLEVHADQTLIALGLFNRMRARGGDRLVLQESGDPVLDAVFIEHNGLLGDRRLDRTTLAALLVRLPGARVAPTGRRVAAVDAAGVAEEVASAAAARGLAWRRSACRPAPYADLAMARRDGRDALGRLSANTRAQLRRALRSYAASGSPRIERAATLAEATSWLERLASLHQRRWVGRGRPGAFASDAFRRFHAALLERGFPRGEIDLLRASAGHRVIGYLYNFRHGGRVSSYQGGFDYDDARSTEKPGLVCHHLAIARAMEEGVDVYDFLAGDDRYKRSLGSASTTLDWVSFATPNSVPGLVIRTRSLLSRWRRTGAG